MGLSCFRAISGIGLDWVGLDLCAGLLYEHRFAMLILDIFLTASSRVVNKNAGFLGAPPDVFRIKHWTEFEVCSSSFKLFLTKIATATLEGGSSQFRLGDKKLTTEFLKSAKRDSKLIFQKHLGPSQIHVMFLRLSRSIAEI